MGFLAKVMLALFFERFSVAKIVCLVRSTKSKTAKERFLEEVLGSEMMESLKRSFGGSFDALIDQQIEVVDGDMSKPNLGIDSATHERLQKELDVVINSAGLVIFNLLFDDALESNA